MNVTTTEFIRHAGGALPPNAFGHRPIPMNLFGIPTFYLVNLVFILVLALIFYWLLRGSRRHDTPMDLLKKRYVAGEIDKETYLEMREDISE